MGIEPPKVKKELVEKKESGEDVAPKVVKVNPVKKLDTN